jgi:hypothetical protein
MRNDRNLVEQVVDRAFEDEGTSATVSRPAAVAEMARTYVPVPREGGGDNSDRLLGFLLNLSYDDVTIVTCDAWKRKCGGVPRNTLVMLRLALARVSKEDAAYSDRLIVVRINDSVPTPVDSEQKAVIFQIHKAQANVDPITGNELTWSALKGKIIGVFYDDHGPDGNGEAHIGFNRAVDTFFSPHFYEVYVPRIDHLDVLVNAFSEDPNPLEIGVLRYVETPPVRRRNEVAVKVNPTDFSGKSYGHRTGLFGKTRFGKSNTMKVIADTILERGEDGQIIFDPSTEYTYWNEQDQGCLAARHPERCVRYSLDPQPREGDRKVGLPLPKALQIDFFGNAEVGKSLIFNLWASENGRVPDYIVPAQNWEPAPISEAPNFNEDQSGYNRYWRTMGIWWAILYEAGFTPPSQHTVPLDFRKDVK